MLPIVSCQHPVIQLPRPEIMLHGRYSVEPDGLKNSIFWRDFPQILVAEIESNGEDSKRYVQVPAPYACYQILLFFLQINFKNTFSNHRWTKILFYIHLEIYFIRLKIFTPCSEKNDKSVDICLIHYRNSVEQIK